jgi:hypothetical protein
MIVSDNHTTTAAQVTAELYIHLEDPGFTKTVRLEFHKSHMNSTAATAKPKVTKSNVQTC